MDIYTYENFEALKPSDLTNQAIADIIGTTPSNVRMQLKEGKKLPTWARAMVWAWMQKPAKDIQDIAFEAALKKMDEVAHKEERLQPMHATPQPNRPAPGNRIFPCGCTLDAWIFRRGSDCKISKENHN